MRQAGRGRWVGGWMDGWPEDQMGRMGWMDGSVNWTENGRVDR